MIFSSSSKTANKSISQNVIPFRKMFKCCVVLLVNIQRPERQFALEDFHSKLALTRLEIRC